MKLLSTLTLLTICLTATGQTSSSKKESGFRVDTLLSKNDGRHSYGNIHTEIKYTDVKGNGVIIQNSGPRGGRGFTDATGVSFGYRVFWTRIINEAAIPLELTITFPADSIPLPSPDSYMKVFLHPDTLTPGVEAAFDDARKQFADTTLLKSLCHTPTRLQRTINPKDSCLIYTVVLRHHQLSINSPRAGFVLKQHRLFYRIAPEFGNEPIPCGRIVF